MIYSANNIWKAVNRRKLINASFESPLRRCLVFLDLFMLGVGGSVDVALYVVMGNVIRDFCGPSILISMTFGFLVCFGGSLCYAEFASYIPTSGSDYDYIYSTLGELCGFIDGWSVLVASVVATAALAQGAADLLGSLTNSATFDNLDSHVPLIPDHALLASNMNIVAMLIVILVMVITAAGVQGSIRFNDCIVVINLIVVLFTFILGAIYIDFDNWSSWDKFAPYGVNGILKSMPFTLFFYSGFASLTFSTEEVINPHHIMPKSIVASLFGILVPFLLIAFVLTLIVPYNQIPKMSPLSDALAMVAFKESKYIIAFGGCCSCFSSVLTASYGNSRLSYVMSRDGLLAQYLHNVNKKTLIPIYAVVTTGIIAALLAAFVNLAILVEVCSILALLPYCLLCFAVITLRHKEESETEGKDCEIGIDNPAKNTNTNLEPSEAIKATVLTEVNLTDDQTYKPPVNQAKETKIKLRIKIALAVLVASSTGLALVVRFCILFNVKTAVFSSLVVIFIIPLIISILVIYKTPSKKMEIPFSIPLFPFVPTICLSSCMFFMLQYSMWAWILFSGNSLFGLIIYFGYGVRNSSLQKKILNSEMEWTEPAPQQAL